MSGVLIDSTPGLRLWERIVSELADLQDSAPGGSGGSVVNPITGSPYLADTCCAAAVFAAEHLRTDDPRWRERAGDALRAARGAVFRGIGEPEWDSVHGWRDRPGSLPPTAIAVDACCDALTRLGLAPEDDEVRALFEFLGRCRTARGGFAHNVCVTGDELDVQNANAAVLYLVARLAPSADGDVIPVGSVRGIRARLRRGQAASGFWRYYDPGRRAALREAVKRTPIVASTRSRASAYATDGGDVMHHLMTLYFAARCVSRSGVRRHRAMLRAAWRWIGEHLVPAQGDGLAIDWSAELAPQSPQLSNSRDTNAYFLILATLPRLASLGVVAEDESARIARALVAHVSATLVTDPGHAPCVAPHEGPPEIVARFLPMFEQSAAWKGALLAQSVIDLP